MSYARILTPKMLELWNQDEPGFMTEADLSDVYVFGTGTTVETIVSNRTGESSISDLDGSYHSGTVQETVDLLLQLRDTGYKVPQDAIDRLTSECPSPQG